MGEKSRVELSEVGEDGISMFGGEGESEMVGLGVDGLEVWVDCV